MNVFVYLAPGFEEIEAITVIDYLRRAKVNVTTVSVPERDSDEISSIVTGSHGIPVITDMVLHDCKNLENLPDAVYFPGGMPGAENLASNNFLFTLITKMEEENKIIAAMCAAPAVVLAKTGVLSNRKWTCYQGMEEEILNSTENSVQIAELMENSVHVKNVPFVFDNNVLTGRGPGTAEEFAMKFVELMTSEETATSIHNGSCQR